MKAQSAVTRLFARERYDLLAKVNSAGSIFRTTGGDLLNSDNFL